MPNPNCSLCRGTGSYTQIVRDYSAAEEDALTESVVACDMCDFDWKAYVRGDPLPPECHMCNDTGTMQDAGYDEGQLVPLEYACPYCDEGAKKRVLRHMRRNEEVA